MTVQELLIPITVTECFIVRTNFGSTSIFQVEQKTHMEESSELCRVFKQFLLFNQFRFQCVTNNGKNQNFLADEIALEQAQWEAGASCNYALPLLQACGLMCKLCAMSIKGPLLESDSVSEEFMDSPRLPR